MIFSKELSVFETVSSQKFHEFIAQIRSFSAAAVFCTPQGDSKTV